MNVFIPCDDLKNYFLKKFIFTQSIFAIAMLLSSLKQLFWKKSVFCIRYLYNNTKDVLLVNNKANTKGPN